jgi:hypothetical protein
MFEFYIKITEYILVESINNLFKELDVLTFSFP